MLQPDLLRTSSVPLLAACAAALSASPALAHTAAPNGGAAAIELDVTAVKCGSVKTTGCPRGEVLRLSGEGLARTRAVTFLGKRGKRDDRTARPTRKTPHRVHVAVPSSARSGPLKVVAAGATVKGPRVRVVPGTVSASPPPASSPPPSSPPPPSARPGADGGVFPILGEHDYGTEVNRFGGGRNHRGQDVFAACGTPLVAALPGVVSFNQSQAQAGNYVVIQADDGTDQAYMHLRAPGTVKVGQRVAAGQQIGEVGDSGRATGCHLHFELWTAPGWYDGGKAIDPLAKLRSWDSAR